MYRIFLLTPSSLWCKSCGTVDRRQYAEKMENGKKILLPPPPFFFHHKCYLDRVPTTPQILPWPVPKKHQVSSVTDTTKLTSLKLIPLTSQLYYSLVTPTITSVLGDPETGAKNESRPKSSVVLQCLWLSHQLGSTLANNFLAWNPSNCSDNIIIFTVFYKDWVYMVYM